MKKYIIFLRDVHNIGGTQMYVANKVNYLRKNNWNVFVLHYGFNCGFCAVSKLDEFVKNRFQIDRVFEVTNGQAEQKTEI